MIRRAALLVPIAILMSAGAPAAIGGDNLEAAALTTVIKRALAEPSTNFSAIRGKRIDSDRYFTTVPLEPKYLDCIVWDRSDSPDMAAINLLIHKQSQVGDALPIGDTQRLCPNPYHVAAASRRSSCAADIVARFAP